MIARTLLRSTQVLARHQPTIYPNLRSHLQWQLRFASVSVKVPTMAESISEGTLKQFSKKVGDYVEADEEIATIETDKIDVAVNAPEAGTITELVVEEDSTVTVGQEIAKLDNEGSSSGSSGGEKSVDSKPEPKEEKKEEKPEPVKEEKKSPEKAPKEEKKESAPSSSSSSSSPPSPSPTKSASKPAPPQPQPQQSKSQSSKPQTDEEKKFALWSRDERRVKMNRMRLRIAERLKTAQNTAASLTTFQEVDMSSLVEFKDKYKEEYVKRHGVKLGFMGAFAKACVLAMKEIPSVNAAIEGPNGGDTIVYHDFVDISVAVATEKGLTTPVVRNVESMNILEIERVITELGRKARDGKLTIEDMAGGTFTISNGGVFGSLMSTPIINPPQSAVLGLHGIFNRAVLVGDKVKNVPMMNLALTYDHRLIDGREAATFLVKVKQYIQDPRKMLLD